MALTIDPNEVLVFNPDLEQEKVEILIKDGLAMARRMAPCIDDEEFEHADAAVAIIRSAVLRWAESGSGALTSRQDQAGSFMHMESYDNRQTRRSLFYPSEIRELQALCQLQTSAAFAIDTLPSMRRGCLEGNQATCSYLFASTNSPCETCGEVLRPGWWKAP